MTDTGKRLKAAREGLGWTVAQASTESNVSIWAIQRFERSEGGRWSEFVRLARALCLDPVSLFEDKKEDTFLRCGT